MRRFLVLSALSLSLLATSAVRAEGPAGGGGRSELHAIFAQLGLSADQKAALKSLRQQRAEQEKGNRQELREAKRAFEAAMTGNASDEQLRAAHDALSKKREEFAARRFEDLLSVRQILTPEQRNKFNTLYLDFKRGKAAGAAAEE